MNFSKKNHEHESKNRSVVSKTKSLLFFTFLMGVVFSCSKSIDYSPEYIEQTSGRYLYNQDEVIDAYYENGKLFLKWRGAEKIKTVALDEDIFFVAVKYKKLHFVQHP